MVHIRRFAFGLIGLGLLILLLVVLVKYFFFAFIAAWLAYVAYAIGWFMLFIWKGGKYN